MHNAAIPIIIGVTGHRDLVHSEINAIRQMVSEQLKALQIKYPHSTICMLNSLAAGADTVCAEEALKLGIPLLCVLPMEQAEYEKTFSNSDLLKFRRLLSEANDVFLSPSAKSEIQGHDSLYKQAGIYIVEHSHILMTLWNGDESDINGCGTAATVYYAIHGDGAILPSFDAGKCESILHIHVNRISSDSRSALGINWILHDSKTQLHILEQTDTFNAEAVDVQEQGNSLLPDEALNSPVMKRLDKIYRCANSLSVKYQMYYNKTLLFSAIFCVALVLAYLLYDELDSNSFLIVYILILAVYWGLCRFAVKLLFLDKHLQYRILAEAARVQLYLCANGQNYNAAQDFTWTQKFDTAWIRKAIDATLCSPTNETVLSDTEIRNIWISSQLDYHRRAVPKTAKQNRFNRYASIGISAVMVLVLFIVLITEFNPNIDLYKPFPNENSILSAQSLMKILWGLLSAVTLFLSDYFGKLSLSRKENDHYKMISLFEAAGLDFERFPDRHSILFRNLAREELIENGNWYSYTQENTPSFNL